MTDKSFVNNPEGNIPYSSQYLLVPYSLSNFFPYISLGTGSTEQLLPQEPQHNHKQM